MSCEPDGLRLVRPVYGGKLLCRVATKSDALAVVTFRPNALGFVDTPVTTPTQETITVVLGNEPRSSVVETAVNTGGRVSLQEAEVIVSGGRGLGDAEGFTVIEDLADALGGAVGASRVAVDSGWISVDHQVGQTGKAVSPTLVRGLRHLGCHPAFRWYGVLPGDRGDQQGPRLSHVREG